MAEEQQASGQNLWLLLVSLGLGLIVVVIYNVHIYNVRREGRGQNVELLRVTRDIDPGEKLKEEDVEVRVLPKQYEGSLGNVLHKEDLEGYLGDSVNRRIQKGGFLLYDHMTGTDVSKPSSQIRLGNVAITVPLDSKVVPGDILRTNDQVNILAMIGEKGALKTYRILRGVRVLAIGGEGIDPGKVLKSDSRVKRLRTYRSITIELPEEVSIQLANVLTHVSGGCWVELRPISERKEVARINPELSKLADAPARPLPGETPGFRGDGGPGGAVVPGGSTWE